MPKHNVDHLDKILVKSMDLCEFLAYFTEDLKIEGNAKNTEKLRTCLPRICGV